jgi:Zn-dependent protease with chaperone function
MSAKKYFPNLKREDFMHPTDSKALSAIKMLPGIPALINWKNKNYNEKLIRIVSMGDDIRVTKKTFKKIYDMTELAALVLDMPIPDVFINQSPSVNAFVFGSDSPMIQIYSGLIELMSEDELLAVIAHEMGHIKCAHVLYKTVADLVREGKNFLGPFQIVFDVALALTLLEWDRKSEFSADRAALLVTQDAKTVITMLMKLAGGSQKIADQISYEDFLEQSRQFNVAAEGVMGKLCKLELTIGRSHPFAVMRAAEINTWSCSEEYKSVLSKGVENPRNSNVVQFSNMPRNLVAKSGLKKVIKINWIVPPILNISGYKIYKSENPDYGFSLKEIEGRDNTVFEDSSLEDGKTYFYFVKAKDLYGTESEPTPIVSATTKKQPDPVADFFPEGEHVRKATLRWIEASSHNKAMKINIYRSEHGISKFKKLKTVPITDSYFQDENLSDDKTYFYYVVVDDETICSEQSKIIAISTKKLLKPPKNIQAEHVEGNLQIKWPEVHEAAYYEVYENGSLFDSKIGKSFNNYFSKTYKVKAGKKLELYIKAVDCYERKSQKSDKITVQPI